MSNTPSELKYAKSHEWARLEDDGTVTVGITDHAQEALGDVVFVELPEAGANLKAGDDIAVVESVKAASDIYAPISGEVIATNPVLEEAPETINEDPYGEGWFFRIKPEGEADFSGLLSAEGYQQSLDDD